MSEKNIKLCIKQIMGPKIFGSRDVWSKKNVQKTKTLKIGYKRCEQILVSNSQDIADMDQWTNVTRIYVAGTNTPMTL